MEWDHHYCLACDGRTENNDAYCSHACREADAASHMRLRSPPHSPDSADQNQRNNCMPVISSIAVNGRIIPTLSPPRSATSATNPYQPITDGGTAHGAGVPASVPFPASPYPGPQYSGSTAPTGYQTSYQPLLDPFGQPVPLYPGPPPPPAKYSHQYPHSLSATAFDYSAIPPAAGSGSDFPTFGPTTAPGGQRTAASQSAARKQYNYPSQSQSGQHPAQSHPAQYNSQYQAQYQPQHPPAHSGQYASYRGGGGGGGGGQQPGRNMQNHATGSYTAHRPAY